MQFSVNCWAVWRGYRNRYAFSLQLWKNIFLGSHVIINMNCTFVDDKEIVVGSGVLIASNVQIYTAGHPVLPQERLNLKMKRHIRFPNICTSGPD